MRPAVNLRCGCTHMNVVFYSKASVHAFTSTVLGSGEYLDFRSLSMSISPLSTRVIPLGLYLGYGFSGHLSMRKECKDIIKYHIVSCDYSGPYWNCDDPGNKLSGCTLTVTGGACLVWFAWLP